MLFNSYAFIFVFLPITLWGYVVLGKYSSRRVALVWLISASLFYYGWWNPAYLGLILGSMLFNYAMGAVLSGNDGRVNRKFLLVIGISANLSLLAYYKYANFFIETINAVLSTDWNIQHIILPLAISFFTFQQITYLIDTYRGETREYNFLQYALFVSFFPQLIAGPIVHHREMMPQFARLDTKHFNHEYFAIGLTIFFMGLFKKVVLADSLSPYAIETFSAVSGGNLLSFFEAWKGVLAYTFQLYFDFSGYSDMAVGSAYLFGIRLPLNFNSPYKSLNIIEFWQRWHITLSRFLRDYLYIPLGGNRKGTPRRYLNLMITMLLGGLWHGAGWTYIAWGGLHGIYLVINHAWRYLKTAIGMPGTQSVPVMFLSRCLTFTAVVVAWVYFRADTIEAAHAMLKSMAGFGGVAWPEVARGQLGVFADIFSGWGLRYQPLEYFNGAANVLLIVSLIAFTWLAPNVQQLFYRTPAVLTPLEESYIAWHPNKKWLVFVMIISVVSILKLGQISEFLYFQF